MKIITRGVIDWATLEVEEEDSFEHEGSVALCKDSGSPPQAVDPFTQAAAQYGLSTGTAQYNAGLNRTNQTNPLGSSTWSVSGAAPGSYYNPAPAGYSGQLPDGGHSVSIGGPQGQTMMPTVQQGGSEPSQGPGITGGSFGLGGSYPGGSGAGATTNPGTPGSGLPAGSLAMNQPPPTYTLNTQLAPQFQNMLQQPIDTSGLAGMPGGPSTTQDLQTTQDALYKSQQQYLAPEQSLATEQLQSELANSGATPGSAAYNNEMDRLSREQEFQNSSARTSAITGAGAEQSRLFGLGTQGLQNQLAVRNAPISEYNALTGSPGAAATALTPDISGAYAQQLASQTAGYNANVATNNATAGDITSLLAMYLMS